MVYNGQSMFAYLTINFTLGLKIIGNIIVEKGIFIFLRARIWAPIPLHPYENYSRYVNGINTENKKP